MIRARIDLQYKGTHFGGWQKQKETGNPAADKPTIQGELEKALTTLYNQPIRAIGSGRTDAGTHARQQVAHADLPYLPKNLDYRLNSQLPEGIVVKRTSEAPSRFHALASVVSKTYVYRIWNSPTPNPFALDLAYWVEKPLDLERLNILSEVFLGTHDFKSFQTRGTEVPTTIKTLKISRWIRKSHRVFEYQIQGDGFLKQMVRNLVGTQLYALRKGLGPQDLKTILAARDRQTAKDTAPAHGLYLWRVEYPKDSSPRP